MFRLCICLASTRRLLRVLRRITMSNPRCKRLKPLTCKDSCMHKSFLTARYCELYRSADRSLLIDTPIISSTNSYRAGLPTAADMSIPNLAAQYMKLSHSVYCRHSFKYTFARVVMAHRNQFGIIHNGFESGSATNSKTILPPPLVTQLLL